MSLQPGWRRTCRYLLVAQENSSSDSDNGTNSGSENGNGSGSGSGSSGHSNEQQLSFLAIHEFSADNDLGDTVKPLQPVSEWTKKVMSAALGIDAAIYRRV